MRMISCKMAEDTLTQLYVQYLLIRIYLFMKAHKVKKLYLTSLQTGMDRQSEFSKSVI